MCRKAVPKGKRTADRDTIYYLQKKKQFPRCGKCLCIYNDAKWLLMYLFLVDSVDGKLFIAQFSFKNQKNSRHNFKKSCLPRRVCILNVQNRYLPYQKSEFEFSNCIFLFNLHFWTEVHLRMYFNFSIDCDQIDIHFSQNFGSQIEYLSNRLYFL